MTTKHPSDYIAEFAQAALNAGLEISGDIIADGKTHYYRLPDGKKGKKAGWYVLHLDGIPAGAFGSFKSGLTCSWCAKSKSEMSLDEISANKARMDAARKVRDEEKARLRAYAQKKARKIWERARAVDAKHPYVVKKGVVPFGAKQIGKMVIIPMCDIDGGINSLQFILENGDKTYLTGGKKMGCSAFIAGKSSAIYVAEGWATACSIRQAVDACVVVCFDSGNILPIVSAYRERFPDRKIVICADDDHLVDQPVKNPGLTKAVDAAIETKSLCAMPVFGDGRGEKDTDFNDLHKLKGLDAVRNSLLSFINLQSVKRSLSKSNVIPINKKNQSSKTDKPKKIERNDLGLLMSNGKIVPCLANIHDVLAADDEWSDLLAFNEFAYTINKLKPPPYAGGCIGEWDATDDVQTSMWITRKYGFAPSPIQVAEAIEALARSKSFHPVVQYLDGLVWDEVDRLDYWISDYIGAPRTPYIMRVARWFIMGMVARVKKPGVKFDFCLVLEGSQGRRKSSMFRVLGGEWFGDTDLDFNNKDSMGSIRGKWLYELAELGSLMRAEATKQKSFLSRQVDEFRPPYARKDIRSERQLVFGGTTNDWAWNKDDTGGRRFWPVECKQDIDCDGLLKVRDQLFAEAYVRYKLGDRFWPTSEEQKNIFDPEQIKRHQTDGYVEILQNFVKDRVGDFVMIDAAEFLKIDPARLSRDIQTRIGKALTALGCTRVEKRSNSVRFWYRPPEKQNAPEDSDVSGGENGIPF